MRRRVRRLLARISPDLLRQRAERARASTGLRRWVAEPGVDAWFGTFPSEEAATAWAAVDRLAHRYVADGVCTSVEQARGRALTDLVTGNATVDVQVVLTVPAAACAGERATGSSNRAGEDLIEVQGARPSEPMFVRRAWLTGHLAERSGRRAKNGPAPRGRRPPPPASGRCAARAVRPAQRGAPRPGGCPRDHRVPARSRAGGAGPSPRRAVPVPGMRRRGEVLRPRPRATLADRRHHCHEPSLPLQATPSDQAVRGVGAAARLRRHGGVDRPGRRCPQHRAPQRPGRHRAEPRADCGGDLERHDRGLHEGPRSVERARDPPRAAPRARASPSPVHQRRCPARRNPSLPPTRAGPRHAAVLTAPRRGSVSRRRRPRHPRPSAAAGRGGSRRPR